VDEELVNNLIDRDWAPFVNQARRLRLGDPQRDRSRIDIIVRPHGTEDDFRVVLFCDGYDAQAPVLDFADLDDPELLGAPYWPNMGSAPMNSITFGGRQLPIICTPGTRGYHLHDSHRAEEHPREVWRLPRIAGILARFLRRMGPYQGRGI
jgi:hypothetical protein